MLWIAIASIVAMTFMAIVSIGIVYKINKR